MPHRDHCPDDLRLDQFVRGELDPLLRAQIRDHLDECADCEETVTESERETFQQPEDVAPAVTTSPTNDESPYAGLLDNLKGIAANQPSGPSNGRDENPSNGQTSQKDRTTRRRTAAPPTIPGYTDLEYLGGGGMGIVYRARQLTPSRVVALKVLALSILDPTHRLRFRREAEMAAQLDHPRVVPIYHVGEFEGQPFFTMKLLDGENINEHVFHDGPFAPREAASIAAALAEAVEYAHARDVIHRDLKPMNIMIGIDGQPTITDFGLARPIEADEVTLTGQLVGTPSYMAPEQAKSARVGPAADIYALGATVYYMVTGRPPFQAATTAETLRQVAENDPVPLRKLSPTCPRDLETIALKCLEKSPQRRYASAGKLADDLNRFLDGEPIEGRPVSVPERTVRWLRHNPVQGTVASAAVVVLLVAFTLYSWHLGRLRDAERQAKLESILNAATQLTDAPASYAEAVLDSLEEQYDDPMVRSVVESRLASQHDKTVQINRLRLVGLMNGRSDQLSETLAFALADPPLSVDELLLIRRAVISYQDVYADLLWNLTADVDDQRLLRICLFLSSHDPEDARWDSLDERLSTALVGVEPTSLGGWMNALEPLKNRLSPSLTKIYRKSRQTPEGLQAASVLARYAADDVRLLCQLASEGSARQFETIFSSLERLPRDQVEQTLVQILDTPAVEPLDDCHGAILGEDLVAIRRAGAAITLLRLGTTIGVPKALDVSGNYGPVSQFAHMHAARKVDSESLAECLEIALDPDRQFPGRARHESDATLAYGLLLAIGEVPLREFVEDTQHRLASLLSREYENNVNSAVHSAIGWVMQQWARHAPDLLVQKERIDRIPRPFTANREWFVLRLGNDDTSPCMTFVVFRPGRVFPYCQDWRGKMQVSRPFAVSTHEVTRECFECFLAERENFDAQAWKASVDLDLWSPEARCPIMGMSWNHAIEFLRWASHQINGEVEPCYSRMDPPAKIGGEEVKWDSDISRPTVRLPTDLEFTYAASYGTSTYFSFGSDPSLFPFYGWDLRVSHSMPVGTLKPNHRGLFDMHGNADECSHDMGAYEKLYTLEPIDGVGPQRGWNSVRGGGWDTRTSLCGSHSVHSDRLSARSKQYGFRLAMTLPPATTENSAQAAGAGAGDDDQGRTP